MKVDINKSGYQKDNMKVDSGHQKDNMKVDIKKTI